MSGAYFNEFDPAAAAWLRELIKRGLIADGDVDERSIIDVRPADVLGYTQCHFFAGIGGWSYALRLAGWPDDRPVWTGSPPCQPFSVAGAGAGRDDARHLAPHFIDLVREARPAMLFGEQVASADVFGKAAKRVRGNFVAPPQWAWLDDLSDRLEAARYAVGASDFPSAGVGAPHIRQRTFFGAVNLERLADAMHPKRGSICEHREDGCDRTDSGREETYCIAGTRCEVRGLAYSAGERWDRRQDTAGARGGLGAETDSPDGGLVHSISAGLEGHGGHGDGSREPGRIDQDATGSVAATGTTGRMADFGAAGPWKSYSDWFGVCWHPECSNSDRGWCDCNTRGAPDGWVWDDDDGWLADAERERVRTCGSGSAGSAQGEVQGDGEKRQWLRTDAIAGDDDFGGSTTSPLHGFWADADWLHCRDGKWRPVEPGTFPLAHGVSGRVGLLRGYGNAINPWAAKIFIEAFDQSQWSMT